MWWQVSDEKEGKGCFHILQHPTRLMRRKEGGLPGEPWGQSRSPHINKMGLWYCGGSPGGMGRQVCSPGWSQLGPSVDTVEVLAGPSLAPQSRLVPVLPSGSMQGVCVDAGSDPDFWDTEH